MFSYTCFKRANPEHMHSRGETVGNSSSPSGFLFLYVTHILVLHFSTSCPPSCVCAGFVFMTTPVIRRYCRELLVLTQLRCITQTVVAASYLAPGSVLQSGVFFFVITSEADADMCRHFLSHTYTNGLSKGASS